MGTRKHLDAAPEVLTEKTKPLVKRPPMYRVFLLNDDFTPMDFVVDVLMQFFAMNEQTATNLMLQVHHQGRAICGIFTRDIAETKVSLVNDYARAHQHPLLCQMEKVVGDDDAK